MTTGKQLDAVALLEGTTAGPWVDVGDRGWEVRAANVQMRVCDIRGWGYLTGKGSLGLSDDEAIGIQKANARLIAAAPDLVREVIALRARVEVLEDGLGGCEAYFIAREEAGGLRSPAMLKMIRAALTQASETGNG